MGGIGHGARVWLKGTAAPRMRITHVDESLGEAVVSWRWNGRIRTAQYDTDLLTRRNPNVDQDRDVRLAPHAHWNL